jgi:hypothetical protein
MKKCLVILFCLLGLAVSQEANALTFNLTSNHCTDQAGCGAPGTIFGTVDVTQNGANVDFTVALNGPYAFVKEGSTDSQAFKFNATGVVLTDITVDAHVPVLIAATGAFNGDGTGNFSFGINCPLCSNGAPGEFSSAIMFHVANATVGDLTAANNLGNVFVAGVINTTNGSTGPIDATTSTVPDGGSTVTLLGSALLGLGLLRRRLGKS